MCLQLIEEKCLHRDDELRKLDQRQGAEMTQAVERANLDQADAVCSCSFILR